MYVDMIMIVILPVELRRAIAYLQDQDLYIIDLLKPDWIWAILRVSLVGETLALK